MLHTVAVGRTVRTYPDGAAELAAHVADGGTVGTLGGFIASAVEQMRRVDWILAMSGWVDLFDGTGLVYEVEVDQRGRHKILRAAQG